MTDWHFKSASALTRALREKEISSRSLTEHFIDRIESHNPTLNAVVATDFARARARADAADKALAEGTSFGPLHGLPVTIKDALSVEGVVSTGGAPEWATHVPTEDAVAVGRMRAAGAVILGKTNVPYLSGDLQTFNEVYGTTNNPWDVSCGPGGSSGGSAAALAAGLTGLEIGSDIGGSIRTPSHLCGVFGHKPTFGIVPKIGHLPPAPGSIVESDLSVVGPMGRSAADLDLMMKVIPGPTGPATGAWKLDLMPPRAREPRDLRVAVWVEDPFCEIDTASVDLMMAAAESLARAGARVDFAARPAFSLAEITEVYLTMLHANMAARLPDALKERWCEIAAKSAPDDKSHSALQARGGTMSYADWMLWQEKREALRWQFAAFFEENDVILAPILMRPAFPHDHTSNWHKRRLTVNGREREYFDVLIWAGPPVLCYLPSTAVPVGRTPEGLPVGCQLIGPHGGDLTTIAAAGMLEKLNGGFVPPPGY